MRQTRQISNNIAAAKMVKLAAILLQQKNDQVSSRSKNGQVSSNFSAAKNGQIAAISLHRKTVKLSLGHTRAYDHDATCVRPVTW